jgi:hypothetical protein
MKSFTLYLFNITPQFPLSGDETTTQQIFFFKFPLIRGLGGYNGEPVFTSAMIVGSLFIALKLIY